MSAAATKRASAVAKSTTAAAKSAVALAETYYDSDDADRFYFHVWGGEDIHIGIYEQPNEAIAGASHRTLLQMADQLGPLEEDTRVLDLGAGYGGAGRFLTERYGCKVTCLNLSETQNERNRSINAERGLSERVEVVHGNFEELPFIDQSYDVVWSQDAFLHSAQRERVLEEVARVLRPGGRVIFTDPMQADDCPGGVLGPVLSRIHLDSLGSLGFYRKALERLGLSEVALLELTPHLGIHYTRVRDELGARRGELEHHISASYIDRMLTGLDHWILAEKAGYLAWGIFLFHKN